MTRAFLGLFAIWVAATALLGGMLSLIGFETVAFAAVDGRGWLAISVASLLVAMLSVLPRIMLTWMARRNSRRGRSPGVDIADPGTDGGDDADGWDTEAAIQAGVALPGFVAGMLIRLCGTVALFLASSYYLDASETAIAAWVLFWHVGLLWVDVGFLARSTQSTAP